MLMKNMPAVIFATVLGTTIGLIIHFGDLINRLGVLLKNLIFGLVKRKESDISDKEYDEMLLTIIVLFCAGGTGIYGSIVSGMSGDHTLLISKAILDLFTAMIFSCLLGPVVSFIAIPQFIIFFTLFSCGGMIMPYTTPEMVDDFKAVGGIILLATSFRMIKVKMFPVADMIPAMILAMPISHIWTTYIMPML
jgi:integral membrane protein